MAFVIGGTVSVTAFLYLRGYFSTVFLGLQPLSHHAIINPDYLMRNGGTNMKLAEALQERADLNRRIEQLRYRLSNNVLVQEGEKPLEDPAALLEELESSFTRLEWLIARINLTNCAVKVEGRSLTELIARRDVLSLRADAYRRLVEEASQNTHRATRTEIKILSAVDVPALQRQADDASRELRLLDNTLQATNWTADLME